MSMGGFQVIGTKHKPGTIRESALNRWKQEVFYRVLNNQGLEKLIIFREFGAPIVYKGGFLQGILENKPPLADLTRMCSVEFPSTESKKVPKAKLLLCGSKLNMNEDRVDLKDGCASLDRFEKVIQTIETCIYDSSVFSSKEIAFHKFLGFIPPSPPKGIGQSEWEKYAGTVGEVPPLSEDALKRLNGPCLLTNVEDQASRPRMWDTHVVFWRPSTINGKPLSAILLRKTKMMNFRFLSAAISQHEAIHQPIEKGYWLAMYKKPLAEVHSFIEQGYAYPQVLEALAGVLLNHAVKSKGMLRMSDRVHYTLCEELYNGKSIIMGGVDANALDIFIDNGADKPGICPVMRL